MLTKYVQAIMCTSAFNLHDNAYLEVRVFLKHIKLQKQTLPVSAIVSYMWK